MKPRDRALACVLLGGIAAGPDRAVSAEDVTALTPGRALDREMAAGEVHRYSLDLRAGDYVQVLVEQRGADVIQTLTAPDGTVVGEIDWPSQFLGPDPLAAVATQTGTYVLSLKADAVANPPRGAYQIRLEAIREPSGQDQLRVKAMQAGGAETKRLFRSDRRAALGIYREALDVWRELGDRRMEMWTEMVVGVLHAQGVDDFPAAIQHYRHVLAIATDLGDEWAEGRVRYNLGTSLRRIGEVEEGVAHYERALVLQRAAGRQDPAARILSAIGHAAALAGEPQRALDVQFEALGIFQALENTRSVAVTRNDIASTYLVMGDFELALEQSRLALPAFGREPAMRGGSLIRIGTAHFNLGDRDRAREAYAEAAGIFKTTGNRIYEADAYLGLGDVEQQAGALRAARQTYASALEVYRTGAYRVGEGMAQCRLGEAERRLGDAAASRAAFEAARALASQAGPQVGGCAEAGLARLFRDAGALPAALGHAEAALTLAESIRSRIGSGRARATTLASQQALYELLIDLFMRQHAADPAAGRDAAAFEMSERARARSLLALLSEGGVDVRQGVDPELLAAEQSLKRAINARAEEQALALAAPAGGEQAAALGRELDGLLARLAETELRIRRASPGYAALTQPQPLTLPEIREQVLDSDTQLLQFALGETRSFLWVVSATRLETFVLAPRADIERAAREVHERASRAPAAGAAQLKAGSLEVALGELGRLILAPAAAALTGKRLLVVAPAGLQLVPFAALPLASRFELVSAPSASVIATLRSESRERRRGAGTVAVFADPVFEATDPRLAAAARPPAARPEPIRPAARGAAPDALERAVSALRGNREGGLGRLPFSGREAAAIRALAPPRQTLTALGFDATRATATSPELGGYRIVHFATHGVLNTQRPALSGLVLSLLDPAGRRQDGFLRLHDVYNLKLGADLVVLSGCQTALGKEVGGEGLVGLTRGFLYAGADRVVASLWQVDDESTAELMKRFYRAMLRDGRRPAEALRAAQLELAADRRWSAPFYWAGFVLQGEWR